MKLTETEQAALGEFFLFRALPVQEARRLIKGLEGEEFAKGATIYSAHRFRRCLGILLEGRALVRKERGPTLRILERGDCFGVAALFAPAQEYVTTVEAKTPCRIVFLSGEELETLFRRWPDMAMAYIAFLAGRVQFLNRKIDSFTRPTAESSLAFWLWEEMDEDGLVRVEGGYARLARELNMGRASLYRCLEQLEERGLLTKEGPVITIRNPEGIKEQAGR